MMTIRMTCDLLIFPSLYNVMPTIHHFIRLETRRLEMVNFIDATTGMTFETLQRNTRHVIEIVWAISL